LIITFDSGKVSSASVQELKKIDVIDSKNNLRSNDFMRYNLLLTPIVVAAFNFFNLARNDAI
jgi:hypothetical protein